jgi:hypothetical protein
MESVLAPDDEDYDVLRATASRGTARAGHSDFAVAATSLHLGGHGCLRDAHWAAGCSRHYSLGHPSAALCPTRQPSPTLRLKAAVGYVGRPARWPGCRCHSVQAECLGRSAESSWFPATLSRALKMAAPVHGI